MADLIQKPGVEITQIVQATPVTPVTPTLVPCIVGAAYEVVEATAEGVPNQSAQVSNISYGQYPVTIPASSFPTNHADINEVSVIGLTDEISATLFKADGATIGLNPNDPSAYLDSVASATRPAVFLKTATGTADTLKLFSSSSSVLSQISITGANTLTEIIQKINDLAGFEAYDVSAAGDYDLVITLSDIAANYGPNASIKIISNGDSALLNDDNTDIAVEGSGLHAVLASGKTSTSFITQSAGKFYRGDHDAVAPVSASALADIVNADNSVPGWLPSDWNSTTSGATVANFVSVTALNLYNLQTALPNRHGDLVYVDGVELGMVLNVKATSIEVGSVDAANSEYDNLGKPAKQVYNRISLNSSFAPNSVYFVAKSLTVREADGTANARLDIDIDANTTGATAATATLTAADATAIALNGTVLIVDVTENDVQTSTFTFVFDANFASYQATVDRMNELIIQSGLIVDFGLSVNAGIVISTKEEGSTMGLSIRSKADGSTALDAFEQGVNAITDAGSDLIADQTMSGSTFTFTLDDNPVAVAVDIDGTLVSDLVDSINLQVGYALASAFVNSSDNKVYLRLESATIGRNSKISLSAFAPLGILQQNDSGSGRPNPNISVSSLGAISFGPNILRTLRSGSPISNISTGIGVSYRGLRLDLSSSANDPGLLQISDITELVSLMSPIDTRNPLSLGIYYALLNAGSNITVSAIGVDDVSSAEPEGTALAYIRAFEFLESYEVYGIAPLSHSEQVIQIANNHVTSMSAPEGKKERVLISSPTVPTRRNDLIASSGESAAWGSVLNLVDTGDVGLEDAVNGIGLDPTLPIPAVLDNNFEPVLSVEISGEQREYSIASISGSTVTVRLSGMPNADGYYSTSPIAGNFTDATYSVFLRGSKLTVPGSDTLIDKNALATTVRDRAKQYNNKRQIRLFPDTVQSVINGVEQSIPAYYFASAISGKTAGLSPETPLSRRSMDGFTNVSAYDLTDNQLNIISAGNAVVEVESPGLAPSIRIQASTAPDAIETREYSITKAVDAFAKTLRVALKNRVGSFNITQTYVDDTTTIVDVICQGAVEQGLLENAVITLLEQDETQPDTLKVEVDVDVLYPANYIKVTILV